MKEKFSRAIARAKRRLKSVAVIEQRLAKIGRFLAENFWVLSAIGLALLAAFDRDWKLAGAWAACALAEMNNIGLRRQLKQRNADFKMVEV